MPRKQLLESLKGRARDKNGADAKRLRGELSCAECRRLKLKCDKKIPCTTCVRRGCQIICPNGELSSGKGSRYVLADTGELHASLTKLSERIRSLEDALSAAHSLNSEEPHELLSPSLLDIKHVNLRKGGDSSKENRNSDLSKDILDSFGDLTLSERQNDGASLLIPPTHHTPTYTPDPEQIPLENSYPAQIVQLIHSSTFFSFPYLRKENQRIIEQRLPSYERALTLCENYLQNVSCWIRIEREQIFEELLPLVYKGRNNEQQGTSYPQDQHKMVHPHDLALLFSVFALGSACDFTRPLMNKEADVYNDMARAALGLHSIIDGTTLSTVQTLTLCFAFDLYSFRTPSLERTWRTFSVASTLAASIGLHKEPDIRLFGYKMAHRRRIAFWELRVLDVWKTLGSGKPLAIHPDDISCRMPFDTKGKMSEDRSSVPTYWQLKYTFTQDVLVKICTTLHSAKPFNYADVVDLDLRLRKFQDSDFMKKAIDHIKSDDFQGSESVRIYLQNYTSSMMRDIVLQLLHRNFFARALIKHPEDPFQSQFEYSFRVALESASSLLSALRSFYEDIPNVLLRYWSIWAHTLNSCVILGSAVVRAPGVDISLQAYAELLLSMECLRKASIHPAIQSSLPVIERLSKKAHEGLKKAGKEPDIIRKTLGIGIKPFVAADSTTQTNSQNTEPPRLPINSNSRSSNHSLLSTFLSDGLNQPSVFAPSATLPIPFLNQDISSSHDLTSPYRPQVESNGINDNVSKGGKGVGGSYNTNQGMQGLDDSCINITHGNYATLLGTDLNLAGMNDLNVMSMFGFSNHGAYAIGTENGGMNGGVDTQAEIFASLLSGQQLENVSSILTTTIDNSDGHSRSLHDTDLADFLSQIPW